jgi:hypothetical protein
MNHIEPKCNVKVEEETKEKEETKEEDAVAAGIINHDTASRLTHLTTTQKLKPRKTESSSPSNITIKETIKKKCSLCQKEGHRSDNKKFHPAEKSTTVPKIEVTPVKTTEMSDLESVNDDLAKTKAELERGCKFATSESYASDSVYGKLKQIGNQLYSKQNAINIWRNTPLEAINELKPDFAGKVGEEILKVVCLACGIKNESTGDKNSKDGTYDQKMCDALKKVEIKTARLGGEKYQHDNLKNEGCDYWLFVDINPDGGCITILPRFDLTNKHPITKTTPTPRKGTTDVYKWDFTENHFNKFVTAGVAIRFDKNTPISRIGEFIKAKVL